MVHLFEIRIFHASRTQRVYVVNQIGENLNFAQSIVAMIWDEYKIFPRKSLKMWNEIVSLYSLFVHLQTLFYVYDDNNSTNLTLHLLDFFVCLPSSSAPLQLKYHFWVEIKIFTLLFYFIYRRHGDSKCIQHHQQHWKSKWAKLYHMDRKNWHRISWEICSLLCISNTRRKEKLK